MDKRQNVLLAVGRSLLAVALCVLFAAVMFCLSLKPLFERSVYEKAVATDAVISALHAEVLDHMASECLFYDLPYDTLKTAVPVDMVKTILHERASVVYEALENGAQMSSVIVDPAPFKAAIDSFFNTLPSEERPLDPDASATIAAELAEGVSWVMNMGIGDKLINIVHPLFARAHRFIDMGVWFLFAVIVLAAVSMLPVKTTLRQRAYSTAGALFIGSALVSVPTWLFAGLDFPDKLAIGDSALRELVNTVLYTAIHRMTLVTTTVFIVCAALLTASVVWLVKQKEEKTVS